MQDKFNKYQSLADSIEQLYFYDKLDCDYLEDIEEAQKQNADIVAQIRTLFESGFDFNLKANNVHSVFDIAVTTDNIELIKLLFQFNAPYYSVHHTPLHRAAEFGSLEVVKYLIEEKGFNPEKKDSDDFSVLQAARSSKHSENVVPYLVKNLLDRKYEKLPAIGKQKELAENNIRNNLSNLGLSDELAQKLEDLITAIFVEEHSVSIAEFFEEIKEQNPDLIFACIELINHASAKNPTEKTAKKIPSPVYVHHGDLTITGNAKVSSVMVTGNLTIQGNLQNLEGEQIYVGGNLIGKNIYTEGPMIIGGDLIATEISSYYNDYKLEVKGVIKADKLIIDNHLVIAHDFEVKEIIKKGNIEPVCRSTKDKFQNTLK